MSQPPVEPSPLDRVAERALAEVRSGMRLGLGTGRAAEAFIRRLGRAAGEGLEVVGVATSDRSEKLAREVGVRTVTIDAVDALDLAFDGADEVAPDGSLTKGLGAAMLRERVVAWEAARFVVLVTPEKIVSRLGERCPLPIEVVPFAVATAQRRLAKLGARAVRRATDAGFVVTDNGNAVIDLWAAGAAGWSDARALDAAVRAVPGVVDTGFFFDRTSLVLVGDASGVRELRPSTA
jgi:ribose 5-phosphate isomerase A